MSGGILLEQASLGAGSAAFCWSRGGGIPLEQGSLRTTGGLLTGSLQGQRLGDV